MIDVHARTIAHTDDPATSHLAARASPMRKSSHRAQVLRAYATHGPASTAELADITGHNLTELRRRATDLLNLGLIERLERTDGRPRPGHLLHITEAGRRALKEIR